MLDFGIAKLLLPDETGAQPVVTRRSERLLTPEYASPEQIRGEPVVVASDVYCLGVLLYELLTGQRPFRASARTPIQKKVYGPEAVREFFRTWAGTFDDWGFEAEEIIDAGSSVFVCLHQWGRGKGSGIPVENRYYAVWTFENGKVIRYRGFMDRTEALEAAGLRE